MIPELRIRIHLGLNFLTLSLCLVGLFIDSWGEGDDVQVEFKDIPVSSDSLKKFEYKRFTEIGIFRSCFYESCVPNILLIADVWKIIVGLGILSICCLSVSTCLSGFQICSEAKRLVYGHLGFHLLGVLLYTATITLYCWETSGIILGLGFYFAVIADMFSLCTWIGACSSVLCTNNKIEPHQPLQT